MLKILSRQKNSFVYGSSTCNQLIECWWSILRRSRLNWWINVFKDMCAENIVDNSLTYHVVFLRFCFLGILQEELDETRRLWNNHFVRKSRKAECPGVDQMCCFINLPLWEEEIPDHPLLRQMWTWLYHTVKHVNFLAALNCGFCSTYHEWMEYYNAKNPTSSCKRAFYNSTSKRWFCLKRFLVQIYSNLLVCYLHVLHSDTSKIWGVRFVRRKRDKNFG